MTLMATVTTACCGNLATSHQNEGNDFPRRMVVYIIPQYHAGP